MKKLHKRWLGAVAGIFALIGMWALNNLQAAGGKAPTNLPAKVLVDYVRVE